MGTVSPACRGSALCLPARFEKSHVTRMVLSTCCDDAALTGRAGWHKALPLHAGERWKIEIAAWRLIVTPECFGVTLKQLSYSPPLIIVSPEHLSYNPKNGFRA